MGRVSRRQFVVGAAGLGLMAGCGRLPGQAQAPEVPTLGYLAPGFGESTNSPQDATVEELNAFREGLAALGYAEGRNLAIEYRYTGGSEA